MTYIKWLTGFGVQPRRTGLSCSFESSRMVSFVVYWRRFLIFLSFWGLPRKQGILTSFCSRLCSQTHLGQVWHDEKKLQSTQTQLHYIPTYEVHNKQSRKLGKYLPVCFLPHSRLEYVSGMIFWKCPKLRGRLQPEYGYSPTVGKLRWIRYYKKQSKIIATFFTRWDNTSEK